MSSRIPNPSIRNSRRPQRLKPKLIFVALTARLKAAPFQGKIKSQGLTARLEAAPFHSKIKIPIFSAAC